MPTSRRRKKELYVPKNVASAPAPKESPRWLAPVMIASFLAGLIWIVIFYINSRILIPGIGAWNMAVGLGFVVVGFGLATKWR